MLVMSAIEGTHEADTPLQSLEFSGYNEMVHIDHQKNCMRATGYNQVLVMIENFTKYAEAAPCMKASAEDPCDH